MRAATFNLDDAYATAFKVFWHSLMTTDSVPAQTPIFVLHSASLSEGTMCDLESFVGNFGRSLQFVDVSPLIPDALPIKPHNHITAAAFGRLFMASALPQSITSSVYLDVDAVAVRSLRELFELPLTHPIAAADHLAPAVALQLWGDRGGQYFQSGVLVADLARWRQSGVESEFRRILRERGDALPLHDQDVLNLTFANNWQAIPVWLNACRFVRQLAPHAELPERVQYLHFDGDRKPWRYPTNRWEHRVWFNAYAQALGHPFDRRPFRRQVVASALNHLKRTARFALGRMTVPELF